MSTISQALPATPLTDEQLEPLAEKEDVEVLVPEGRPKSVATTRGELPGDITKFWVVTEDYARSAKWKGRRWEWASPMARDEEHFDSILNELRNDYKTLGDGS